ncbi:MAG: hypothetical protein HeimC2_09950 [Candidatus Heimdallarchaeota archaeon LC_2]|nr:MAG: hypothetical protein HeimC2_09950 [Candidatus Heimdallarchaeota archaeon LC_2]
MSENEKHDYKTQQITCPACLDDNATALTHILDIPYYDDFILVNMNCNKCGYKATDFYNSRSKGHTIHEYSVTDISDDSTKIVRSQEATVKIPEIETEIEPIGTGSSWIRNIEGLLEDIHEKLKVMLRDFDNKNTIRSVEKRIKKLKQLMRYEIPFRIIVDDPSGNSLILPADKSKLKISVEEQL